MVIIYKWKKAIGQVEKFFQCRFKSAYTIIITIFFIVACDRPSINQASAQNFDSADVPITKKINNSPTDSAREIFLYLSFDDGPGEGSKAVNEVSLSDSIKITVFVLGKFVFRNDTAKRLFRMYQDNPNIEIGNHSFTHANGHYHLYYQDPAGVKTDFLMNYDTLGLKKKIARLPGRNCWRVNGKSRNDLLDAEAAADSMAAGGYKVFGWDIEWRYDSTGRVIENADEIFNRVERMAIRKNSFIPGNIVILCHDPMLADTSNESELRFFIQKIKSKGNYRFENLSNYPN